MLLPEPRTWKVLLLFLALLGVGQTLLVPPQHASAADARRTGAYTSWQMWGQDGDFISQGRTYSYTGEPRIVASGTAESVRVRVGTTWSASFVAPDGAVLAPGTYLDATRAPFSDGGVGLSVSGDGRGCNTLTGRFAVHEATFDDTGALTAFSATFEQHCEGGKPALFGSVAWRATEPAHAPQPRLSLTGPSGPARYGQSITLTGHVPADSPLRRISLYAVTPAGDRRLLRSGDVDAQGDLTVRVRAHESTTYVAEVLGSDGYADMTATTTVKVAARVTLAVTGSHRRAGRYHLVEPRRNTTILARVSPDHSTGCVAFRLQAWARGHWGQAFRTRCLGLSDASSYRERMTWNRKTAGVRLRVRAEWRGDARNSPATSGWAYLRYTR